MSNIRKEIRPLKLQKLLYYTAGFYYKKYGKDLLYPEYNFYKWGYGPIEPNIYHCFEKYKFNPICELCVDKPLRAQETALAGSLALKQNDIYIVSFDDKNFYEILNEVIFFYGLKSDFVLSKLTNKHDAWKETKNYYLINKDLIHQTFKKLDYGE